MSDRQKWAGHFLAMGIDEEQMMAMKETEFQNMKDYIILNDIKPQTEEDEDAAQAALLKKIMEKKKLQQERAQQQPHKVANYSAPSEEAILKRRQDEEYAREVEKQLELQKNDKDLSGDKTTETNSFTGIELDPEPDKGVTLMIRLPSQRIMRKFDPEKDGTQIMLWVSLELAKIGQKYAFKLQLPTGKELDYTKTLSEQGITSNTILNLI